MKELFLHIGHGKTGTSYIQNALVLSEKQLKECRVAYPITKRDAERVKRNHARISSGNGSDILTVEGKLYSACPGWAEKIVFSSELMFEQLAAGDAPQAALAHACASFERVHVLLFVREPIDFAVSAYQQMVKRHGYHGTLDDYVMGTEQVRKLLTCLDVLKSMSGIDLTMYNYSTQGGHILQLFEGWLGLPEGLLQRPSAERVNRGLSSGELRIQRSLNRVLGASGNLFADRVCQLFPDRKVQPIPVSPQLRRDFFSKFGADIARINDLLPEASRLSQF